MDTEQLIQALREAAANFPEVEEIRHDGECLGDVCECQNDD
jgi:hypothetical protein